MNKMTKNQKSKHELSSIRFSKHTQGFVNTSSIVADESSMVVMTDEGKQVPQNMS